MVNFTFLVLTIIDSHIPIRVKRKRNVSHRSLGELLLKWHAERLKPIAGLLDIGHCNCNVSKATAGIGVATSIASKVGIVLRAVVVGKLKDTLACPTAGRLLLRRGVAVVVAEEVEGEAVGGVL
jgi:hypothetical protein